MVTKDDITRTRRHLATEGGLEPKWMSYKLRSKKGRHLNITFMDNTTTQIPPVLDAQTPSHEWADKTTSALGSQKPLTPTPALPSAVSTPGHDFPGAYPGGSEEKVVEGTSSGGGGILETAKQYIPGQEDVGKALSNATETAKQYLPQAVVSYFREYRFNQDEYGI